MYKIGFKFNLKSDLFLHTPHTLVSLLLLSILIIIFIHFIIMEDEATERSIQIQGSQKMIQKLKIYPNPARELVQISYESAGVSSRPWSFLTSLVNDFSAKRAGIHYTICYIHR